MPWWRGACILTLSENRFLFLSIFTSTRWNFYKRQARSSHHQIVIWICFCTETPMLSKFLKETWAGQLPWKEIQLQAFFQENWLLVRLCCQRCVTLVIGAGRCDRPIGAEQGLLLTKNSADFSRKITNAGISHFLIFLKLQKIMQLCSQSLV